MTMTDERLAVDLIRLDGGTQARAMNSYGVIVDYADAMRDGATFPPIVVFFDGTTHWLADGFHRVMAAQEAEITELPADIRMGGQRDAVLYACGANVAHGLRRTNADKQRAVDTLLGDKEWQAWSDREIARRCGVNHETVSTARVRLSGGFRQIEPVRLVQRNGTTYTQHTANIGTRLTAAPVEEDSEPEAEDAEWTPTPEPPAITANPMAVHYSSESQEWYTPAHIVARVVTVLGEIDLDPCADPGRAIPATAHYTKADDGLTQPWFGRVFCNPPYGDGVEKWTAKLCDEYDTGTVTEAILLIKATTDTQAFASLWRFSICFVRGRLTFSGAPSPAPFPSALVYLGERVEEFGEAFRDTGPIVTRLIFPWDIDEEAQL